MSGDRRKFNQLLIDTAARVRDVEANIDATQARLARSMSGNNCFANRSTSAAARSWKFSQPCSASAASRRRRSWCGQKMRLQAVRTAITLGAVVPEMRAEADALAGDLSDLLQVRKEIVVQRAKLSGDLAVLGREQLRMSLLIDQRQNNAGRSRSRRWMPNGSSAADLAQQVGSIKDLIAKLESSLDSAPRNAHASARAITKDATQPELAALSDPGRLTPAVAFADMRGHMRLPVNGTRIREFGGSDGTGGTQKGLSVASRTGAEITAPCDGWVVYAGPFRSYGQLLILNAGGGYHVLLAGMERISVDIGQFVLTGEPVAVMGDGPQASAAVMTGPKQPVLYVEFRKDGTPIDPSPWWATNEGEKVRG